MTRRPHLTLVSQSVSDDDYAYDPPFWLGIVVMLVAGVVLAPVAYWLVLGAAWVWAAVLP